MTSTTATGLAPETGQQLTPLEVEQARLLILQTRDGMIGATKGLTEAQWNFKPAMGGWSIAEILEHTVIVQECILGPIWQQLIATPLTAIDPNYKDIDAFTIDRLPNRLAKFPAPPFLGPTGRSTPAEELARLAANCDRMTEHLASTPDLRDHQLESPPLKALSNGAHTHMDGYQWLLGCAAHTERHTKQMLEVKADPNFP